MINLNSVTHEKNGRTRYALPGGTMTDRAYYALDVLMEISDLTAKTIEAQKARKSVMKTKSGAVITRKQSGNSRYFLGV
ncbi:MAG TPA: hypothetical protein VFD12_10915 [Oligella sp.]|nr:hypothetical protein [Oligella sp.]